MVDNGEKKGRPDLWQLYRLMLSSRLFEIEVKQIWEEGLISGEMHLGIGEEAIAAGIVSQLADGDAMALDHRGTPPLLMRGVSPLLLLREFLGEPDGLCAGKGGHMHLFSRAHLAASSGIVGASGPGAVGFALAAQHLRPGALAVAFFGEGALNQGMLLESLNLAAAWKLPVLFVCKDNQWAITSRSPALTGAAPLDRAKGFGIPAVSLDGRDVEAVWQAGFEAIGRARKGGGPTFLHACCTHPEGHFLGDPLLRMARQPLKEMKKMAWPLIKSFIKPRGAPLGERSASMGTITSLIKRTIKAQFSRQGDPLKYARKKLTADRTRLLKLEAEVKQEIEQAVEAALTPAEKGEAP